MVVRADVMLPRHSQASEPGNEAAAFRGGTGSCRADGLSYVQTFRRVESDDTPIWRLFLLLCLALNPGGSRTLGMMSIVA